MKRPLGVILSCVLLGIIALIALASAFFIAIMGVVMGHGLPATAQSVPPPPPAVMAAIFFVMAFVALLIGIWTTTTVVGLARLRNWARYSIMALSVCMAGFCLLAILGTVIVAAGASKAAMPPNLPAHTMQAILAFYLFVYVILLAIAVWWLVYFNLRKTKAYFLPLYAANPGPDPALYPPNPYGAPPPPPHPLQPPASGLAGLLSGVPIPVTIMACFFLLGAPFSALCTLLPMPALFLGFIIPRPGSILLYLAFAATSGACGIGLLRLENWSRILTYAYMVVGLINFAVLVTPWGRHRYAAYNQSVSSSMSFGANPRAHPVHHARPSHRHADHVRNLLRPPGLGPRALSLRLPQTAPTPTRPPQNPAGPLGSRVYHAKRGPMKDPTITMQKYTDFAEIKADEYRYWQARPAHERLDAVDDMIKTAYALKGWKTEPDEPRSQRPFVRLPVPWRKLP